MTMSNDSENGQILWLKRKGHELGELFADRHAPSTVRSYVQHSLGIARLAGIEVQDRDMAQVMRGSAGLAAINNDPDSYQQVMEQLLADEELNAAILRAQIELEGGLK